MITYKLTSAALGIVIAGVILFLVRRDHIHIRFAVWWLFVAGSALVLGIFPGLVDFVGAKLGISYPPILLVVTTLGMLMIKILTMDLDRSRQEQNLRRLAQRVALMEEEDRSKS